MATPSNISLTTVSGVNAVAASLVMVGPGTPKKWFYPAQQTPDTMWITVFDRFNPTNKVFELEFKDTTSVPAGIGPYMDNDQYFFVCLSNTLSTLNVPQGALYAWLKTYGAGNGLERLEQVNNALGCGMISRVGYSLVGICGKRSPNEPQIESFESSSLFNAVIQTLTLRAGEVGGKTIYTPAD